jgi:hypothetical protein
MKTVYALPTELPDGDNTQSVARAKGINWIGWGADSKLLSFPVCHAGVIRRLYTTAWPR